MFLPAQHLPPSMEDVVCQAAHHMHASLDNALPTAMIYLDVTPEECLARVEQRQRPGEAGVTLEYLRTLQQQYDQAVSRFPGPKVVIHANGNRTAVLEAVKDAIRLLHAQHTRHTPPRSGRMMPHPMATTPFSVHESAILQRLCPGRLLTTLDPFYLRLFPDQLLALHEVDGYLEGPETHPQGTPTGSSTDNQPPSPLTDRGEVHLSLYEYLPSDANLLYDQATEVPVLYQSGPGSFQYSPLFQAEYLHVYGTPVDHSHRVDNSKALQLYAALGPWAATASGAHIAVAVAPRKALPALRVVKIHDNGAESVYVDPLVYAGVRLAEKQDTCHSPQVVPDSDDVFPWRLGFQNEAYTLDGWIRQVRLRPVIPCGVTLCNPTISTLAHGAVAPLPQEQQADGEGRQARLASCLPHAAGQDSAPTPPCGQLNMLDKPPRRKSAKAALKRMSGWTRTQRQEITDPASVPDDLPCVICTSPFDEDLMMLCDHCDRGYHTYCVGLQTVPEGLWICPECTLSQLRPAPVISSPSLPSLEHSPSEYIPKSTTQDVSDSPGTFQAAQLPSDLQPEEPTGAAAPAAAAGHAAVSVVAADPDDYAEDDALEDPEDHEAPDGPILEVWEDASVLHYLQHNAYNAELLPDYDPGNELKRVDKRAGNYLWSSADNKLFKSPSGKHTSYREVPPPSARPGIIAQMHTDLGHVGATKLCSVLLARFYWRGMHHQVATQLKGCDNCLRHKTLFKLKPELKPLPPSRLWERVSIDTMGPYPATKAGARYIYVAVDAMSKYVEAWPTPKLDSATMAQFFKLFIMANHGLPRIVVTDQGKEFQLLFSDLMTELGVQHVRSAAYHPQGNGQAEAAVKTILHGLQKAVGAHPHSWDEHLPHVLLGLRSATHSTTGYSPFFINTGRHPVLPAERRQVCPAADTGGASMAAAASAAAPAPTLAARPVAADGDVPVCHTAVAVPAAGGPVNTTVSRPRGKKRTAPPALATGEAVGAPRALAAAFPAASDSTDLQRQPTALHLGGQDSLDLLLDEGTRLLLHTRQATRDATHAHLKDNVIRSQEKQKVDYAKRHHGPAPQDVMPPGSFVLMWVPPQNKLSKVASCEGPYRLVEYISGSQALIEDSNGQRWLVAVSRLAPYRP